MFENFSSESKIWVYQADRIFTNSESQQLKELGRDFLNSWNSHGNALTGKLEVLYDRFVVVCVDETIARTSGCSLDKLSQFIKHLEQALKVNLLDRMAVAFKNETIVETTHLSNLKDLYAEGRVNDETLMFNNLVTTLSEFKAAWMNPLKNSWHKRFLN